MDNELKDNQLEQIFDEDKLDEAKKGGKQKSTGKYIFSSIAIAVLVFIIINIGNAILVLYMSNQTYQSMDVYIKLTIPNGYISSSVDTFSFLGGRSNYTISRNVDGKPVILENRVMPFGLLPQLIMTRERGSGGQVTGQWPTNYWEYGYNMMFFFHPDIAYKEYKNDLVKLSEVSDNKVIELGLSFDKPYTISDISKILPNVKINWYWVNAITKEDFEQYKKEAREYDARSSFIPEYNSLGVSMEPNTTDDYFASSYNSFLYNLKVSNNPKFLELLNTLNTNGYADASKVPILGVIVTGTKSELLALKGNPYIKASSFGVITDKNLNN